MSKNSTEQPAKTRSDRLLKRQQMLVEAVRKDIQTLRKIVASGQEKKK